jgi:hypothetical protein
MDGYVRATKAQHAQSKENKQSSITRSGSARRLGPRSNARADQTLSCKTNKQTIGTRSHRGHRREVLTCEDGEEGKKKKKKEKRKKVG